MNTPLELAGFACGLVAVFGAAVGLDLVVGPIGCPAPATVHDLGTEAGEEDHG